MGTTTVLALAPEAARLVFFISVFVFAAYALVISYHWLRYGAESKATLPALALFGIVSAALIGLAASGLP